MTDSDDVRSLLLAELGRRPDLDISKLARLGAGQDGMNVASWRRTLHRILSEKPYQPRRGKLIALARALSVPDSHFLAGIGETDRERISRLEEQVERLDGEVNEIRKWRQTVDVAEQLRDALQPPPRPQQGSGEGSSEANPGSASQHGR